MGASAFSTLFGFQSSWWKHFFQKRLAPPLEADTRFAPTIWKSFLHDVAMASVIVVTVRM
jgi:hypothetical protein